ncbi:translation initiation factor IF-2, mitochondrial [[Candida] railenensis]|uniref:Translation initiation factor IF-2, mitochondrial n=1 Tax=[Candida] railenensis TaxID=45579 RepID=A0A9P0W143_9ASCO|nr:translation initiation factor IF-2, mitochondrial [[Candida] railenensis]
MSYTVPQMLIRSSLQRGLQYNATRQYSDFLRDLPKVGGVSRFGKKKVPPATSYTKAVQAPAATSDAQKKPTQNRTQQRPKAQAQAKTQAKTQAQNQAQGQARSQISLGNRFANKYTNARASSGNTNQLSAYERAKEELKKVQQKNSKAKPALKGKNPAYGRKASTKKEVAKINIAIPTFVTVSNLASIMGVYLNDLLKKLEELGFEDMRHDYILDKENASLIADEFGFQVTMNDDLGADLFPAEVVADKLKPRAPIVTIMGHVDHGKTTILDNLRKSSIVDKEHGGITQHIGAFSVITPISKKKITFLDTPGHAAFLKMRERGANITDIVILVVAADDSVMPQTIEAIKHAKKSGVPIIVAINKCDKPTANPDKVVADVSSHGIEVEDYGGDTQTVRVSGKTGLNMDKLEESVITLSELCDLQAEPTGVPAEGWVIESEVKKGLGNVATVLVKRGTMKTGSFIVAGETYCKIRGMRDESGKQIKVAGPSTPVEIWGWKELPGAGDEVIESKTEQFAKKVIENRTARGKQIQASKDIELINAKRKSDLREAERQDKLNELKLAGLDINDLRDSDLEDLGGADESKDKCKKMNFIIKSDVFGSAEAIKESINGLGNDEVKAVVVFEEAGLPTDNDLDRAEAANAQILCFNIKVGKDIQAKAAQRNIEIKEHNVIYHLIEDVTKVLTDQLAPRIERKFLAEIDVRDIFTITGRNKNKFKIAGCMVATGLIKRTSLVLVERKGKEVFKGKLSSLKHVKDDVNEVKKGSECGIQLEGWEEFEKGDVIKVYEEVVHPRYL